VPYGTLLQQAARQYVETQKRERRIMRALTRSTRRS
jgi:hypothetical protein